MIIDTSAILAVLFREAQAEWVADQLSSERTHFTSTVNLAECLIRLEDLKPLRFQELADSLYAMDVRFEPPSLLEAQIAAAARKTYPINFGDCFAYALAKSTGLPLLTLDEDFRATDANVLIPPRL